MTDDFPAAAPPRPLWLVTLADLALLLVGFLVMVQATHGDARLVAGALRTRFGAEPGAALAVAAEGVAFAPGSAAPGDTAALVAWARGAVRDPRIALTVTGSTDGTARDVDAASGNAALLAADRARAVAAVLAPVVPAGRLRLSTSPAPRRAAIVTQAFAGDQRTPLP